MVGGLPPEPQQMGNVIDVSAFAQAQAQAAAEPGQEPPAAEPQPPAPAPNPEPPAAAFDFKATFGEDFGDADRIKATLEEYKTIKEKVGEYESKLKSYDGVEDPYVKSLLNWVREGKDRATHDIVYHSDPEKLDAAGKVAVMMQVQDGLTPEQAMLIVEDRYKLGEDYDQEDRSVRAARALLEADANKAHKFLAEFRAKESQPLPQWDGQAHIKAWQGHIETTVKGLSSIDLPDGSKYEVPKESLQALQAHIETIVGTEEVDLDLGNPKSKETLGVIAKDFLKAREFDNIINHMKTQWEKAKILEQSHATPPRGTPPAQAAGLEGKYAWMQSGVPPLQY